jgi:hypothetical protein
MSLATGITASGAPRTIAVEDDGRVKISGATGGGGDATAANQLLGLAALDDIYDVLAEVGTEATTVEILAALQGIGAGSSLADVAAALAPLALEATQAAVLAELEAQGITLDTVSVAMATLVTQTDQIEPKLDTINTTLGAPAQEHTTAGSPSAVRLSDGSAFYKGAVAGDNMGADLRVASAAVSSGNPVPINDAGGSLTVDPVMGTAFSVARGTATTTAAQLPTTTYTRPFKIKNMSTDTTVYVGPTSGVTSANGWPIGPGESEPFNLTNSNALHIIAASGSHAYAIGAVQ